MGIKMAPCPFCGRADALCIEWASEQSDWEDGNEDSCQIYCDASGSVEPRGCGASCGACVDEDVAIQKWNERVEK